MIFFLLLLFTPHILLSRAACTTSATKMGNCFCHPQMKHWSQMKSVADRFKYPTKQLSIKKKLPTLKCVLL